MLILRLLYLILLPALATERLVAVLRKREDWCDLLARLRGPKVPENAIWIHGASVGEISAAKAIITGLSDRPVLVTCNTVTGRDRVQSWGLAHVTAALAPLDFGAIARRMTRDIAGLIVLENELWPNRMLAAHRAKVPVILLSARMSDRSAKLWARFPDLVSRVLAPVALVIPQDAKTARNLIVLGVREAVLHGPIAIKAAYLADDRQIPDNLHGFSRNRTVLAASTHPGEEAIVLAAFTSARRERPNLRLILAPRHPERASEILALIAAQGLDATQRSKGGDPAASVYLADTMGELSFWYRLAGVTFLGGSLVDKGGHTPFEPIAYGCPILHGPSQRNFAEIYAELDAAGGAIQVTDIESLASAMLTHLNDTEMAQRAKEALAPVDLAPLIARIKATLPAPPRH